MSITFVKQDITCSESNYICHQVNCQGKMNSGVAKAIREKWPIVFQNYIAKYEAAEESVAELYGRYEIGSYGSDLLLGDIQFVPLWTDFEKDIKHQYVINMFAQEHYGYDGKRYTSYDAFWSCLGRIRETVPKGSRIAFPYKIGSDRGGANWDVIYTMIAAALGSDYDIEICYLNEDEWLLYHLDIEWEDK